MSQRKCHAVRYGPSGFYPDLGPVDLGGQLTLIGGQIPGKEDDGEGVADQAERGEPQL